MRHIFVVIFCYNSSNWCLSNIFRNIFSKQASIFSNCFQTIFEVLFSKCFPTVYYPSRLLIVDIVIMLLAPSLHRLSPLWIYIFTKGVVWDSRFTPRSAYEFFGLESFHTLENRFPSSFEEVKLFPNSSFVLLPPWGSRTLILDTIAVSLIVSLEPSTRVLKAKCCECRPSCLSKA